MRAASFAARAHASQRRKDGVTPYFAHPARVALTVVQIFGCSDPVAIAAALLHDTIEDTATDYDDLAREFGAEVAGCVAALTKNMALPERERERDYDRRLSMADWRARLVKLADQHDNYTDALVRGAAQIRKVAAKCRRAMALAAVDASHPESRRAVAALRSLLKVRGHGARQRVVRGLI
jgi:guanosine-3',5'-bis(diphosphate) 3'-pyrophosphohydrolase